MRLRPGKIIGGALFLVAALVGVAVLGLRASLPQIDGELVVAGINAGAIIARDDNGIPIISAQNRRDLAFATGVAHSQDRFFQMDLIRRQAAGELSELVGEVALGVDKRYRFHRFRGRARAVLDATSATER